MVTDTAFYRYRYYHAATDTPDKLAYPELAQVTLSLFKAFAVLAREGWAEGALPAPEAPAEA
jgi:hypothetical protein